jgi:hypothetical protein
MTSSVPPSASPVHSPTSVHDSARAGEMRNAISRRDVPTVRALLDRGYGANLNLTPGFSDPPIHLAAQNLDWEMCVVLLSSGADANATYGSFSAPLFAAANHFGAVEEREAVCRLLLENGAQPNLALDRSGHQKTPLHLALSNSSPGDCRPLIRLLIAFGGDLNFVPPEPAKTYLTPFQEQVKDGWLENLAFLLDEGKCDPFQKTVAGRSMLQLAQGKTGAQIRAEMIREAQVVWRSKMVEQGVSLVVGEALGSRVATAGPRSGMSPI